MKLCKLLYTYNTLLVFLKMSNRIKNRLELTVYLVSFFTLSTLIYLIIESIIGQVRIVNAIFILINLLVLLTMPFKRSILLRREKREKYLPGFILDDKLREVKRRRSRFKEYKGEKSSLSIPEKIRFLSTLIYYDHENILYYEADLNEKIFYEIKPLLSKDNWRDIRLLFLFYNRKYYYFRLNQIIDFPMSLSIKDFVIKIDKSVALIISDDLKGIFHTLSKSPVNE